MVSVLVSKVVDRGFIAGVMVNVLVSKAVDCGFIGGVMASVLVSKAVDRGFIIGIMVSVIYHYRDKNANPPPMNPRSTAFETSMLTIMPLMSP
jgi:hypothetical protein